MRSKMKKKIRFSVQSQCAWLGEIKVQHALPNKFVHATGIHRFSRWYIWKDQLQTQ